MPDDTALLPLAFLELTQRRDNARFWEVAELRDPDGVLAVVTERVSDGRLSYALFREFEQEGQTKRSAYLAHRHIPGAIRLLKELDRRLEQMEDRSRAARRIAAG